MTTTTTIILRYDIKSFRFWTLDLQTKINTLCFILTADLINRKYAHIRVTAIHHIQHEFQRR
jgi:hypothetical protein